MCFRNQPDNIMINDYPDGAWGGGVSVLKKPAIAYDDNYESDDYTDNDYTDGESEASSDEEVEPHTSQRRRKVPSKCPVKRKKVTAAVDVAKTQMGKGLRDELPKEIVRRQKLKPDVVTSKPKGGRKCPTFGSSSEDEADEPASSRDTAKSLVGKMNALGKKFCKAKNVQRKMLMVSKISKVDINMFGLVINR